MVKVEVVTGVASSDHRRVKHAETKSLSQMAELPAQWLLGAVELVPQHLWKVLLVMSDASTPAALTVVGAALQVLVAQCPVPVQKAGVESHLLCRRCVLVYELCDQDKEIHKEMGRLSNMLTRKK